MIPFHILLGCDDVSRDIVSRIAHARNIDPDTFHTSLSLRSTRGDPLLLTDSIKARDRITHAILNHEHITIFADYDVDGVSSAYLLSLLFKEILGYDRYSVMFPDRLEDGYGLKNKHLDTIKESGSTLIITVDNGITSVQEAQHAKNLGLDMIITDHHEPLEILPDVYALINPKCSSDYPHHDICGCAVAYKLACLLIDHSINDTNASSQRKTYLLPIVTLATVADIVPLHGENRAIVAQGLKLMRNPNTHLPSGISSFLDFLNIRTTVDTYHLGFMIGPRINAGGRIASPHDSLNALIDDDNQAYRLLTKLDELNTTRKTMQHDAYMIARELVDTQMNMVLVIHESFHEGVVGIVAGKLCEHHYKLTLVGKIDHEKNIMTASLRSPDYANCMDFLDYVRDYTIKGGGHHHAGGLSVSLDVFDEFLKRCNLYQKTHLDTRPLSKPLSVDTILFPGERSQDLVTTIDYFAPYGEANPQPLLQIQGTLSTIREIVRDERTMRFVTLQASNDLIPVVIWRCDGRNWKQGETVSIVGTVTTDRQGAIQFQAKAIFSSDGRQCMCE